MSDGFYCLTCLLSRCIIGGQDEDRELLIEAIANQDNE